MPDHENNLGTARRDQTEAPPPSGVTDDFNTLPSPTQNGPEASPIPSMGRSLDGAEHAEAEHADAPPDIVAATDEETLAQDGETPDSLRDPVNADSQPQGGISWLFQRPRTPDPPPPYTRAPDWANSNDGADDAAHGSSRSGPQSQYQRTTGGLFEIPRQMGGNPSGGASPQHGNAEENTSGEHSIDREARRIGAEVTGEPRIGLFGQPVPNREPGQPAGDPSGRQMPPPPPPNRSTANAGQSSGGLFGHTATSRTHERSSSGLFGIPNPPPQPAAHQSSGLFGQMTLNRASEQSNSGLFGMPNPPPQPAARQSSGLFGQAAPSRAPGQPNGGLFARQQTVAPNPGPSVQQQSTAPNRGLFGNHQTVNSNPGLFAQQQPAASNPGIIGQQQPGPSGGLFAGLGQQQPGTSYPSLFPPQQNHGTSYPGLFGERTSNIVREMDRQVAQAGQTTDEYSTSNMRAPVFGQPTRQATDAGGDEHFAITETEPIPGDNREHTSVSDRNLPAPVRFPSSVSGERQRRGAVGEDPARARARAHEYARVRVTIPVEIEFEDAVDDGCNCECHGCSCCDEVYDGDVEYVPQGVRRRMPHRYGDMGRAPHGYRQSYEDRAYITEIRRPTVIHRRR
ncbi:MAG: hypothetical protein M1831_007606 [Alyxoria varia]|nr:MAG: hypothetical protein M1831_007606 [Alyxoria varia]